MAAAAGGRRVQVAVCGPGECTPEEARDARRVGELLAAHGAAVLCGGGVGVMAAVAAGARSAGGLAIGILPYSGDPAASGGAAGRAGAYGGTGSAAVLADLDVAIVTDLGQARNNVLVQSADAVIVVGGSWGALSELALAMRRGTVPVVTLGGWRVLDRNGLPVPGTVEAVDPRHAVDAALAGAASCGGATMGSG
jgi:predicted Rossmann-fold nucleotide-binding protein